MFCLNYEKFVSLMLKKEQIPLNSFGLFGICWLSELLEDLFNGKWIYSQEVSSSNGKSLFSHHGICFLQFRVR